MAPHPPFLTLILVLMCAIPNASTRDYTKWDLPAGAKLRLGKGAIKKLQFSPDSTRLLVITSIGIWFYDVQTGKEIDLFVGHTGHITNVNFSLNGKTLASVSDDATIGLWNVETGSRLKTLKGHTGRIASVSFSPDGKVLASGSVIGSIRLWDVETGSLLKILIGHTGEVMRVSFSPDGKTLVSGSLDGTILVWHTPLVQEEKGKEVAR